MKTCTKCKETKPEEDFHFHNYVRKDGSRGRRPDCIACCLERYNQWKIKNRQKRRESSKKYYYKRKESIPETNALHAREPELSEALLAKVRKLVQYPE